MITELSLHFLQDLDQNNNREWFLDNRKRYELAKAEFIELCNGVLSGLTPLQADLQNTKVKDCILRINRDIRFSANKNPYKNYFAAGFGPGGRSSGRVDFYLQIQPNQSFLGAGMWAPTPANLAKFRQELDYNPNDLKRIIFESRFMEYFPVAHGEVLKTKPKGYSLDHPEIELLKRKELFYLHYYDDSEVLNAKFDREVVHGCSLIKPYQDYLNHLFFDLND